MIWLADSAMTYRCGPYRIYWGIKCWSAWKFGNDSRKLGDAASMKQAIGLCAEHEKGNFQTKETTT
jgi:hypothetical protein